MIGISNHTTTYLHPFDIFLWHFIWTILQAGINLFSPIFLSNNFFPPIMLNILFTTDLICSTIIGHSLESTTW